MDVVDQLRPRAFVMENVKSLGANPRWAPLRDQLRDRAEASGYDTALMILNASHYGVPQARERMFFIGVSEGTAPAPPEPTTLANPPTVRAALRLLPRFGETGNDTMTGARVVPTRDPVMRPTAHRGSLLFNGSGRPLHLDRHANTLPASMGGNATPIIDQDEHDHAVEPWVVGYHRRLADGGTPLARAPKRLRRITVEEAGVLQSFPVGFRFQGPRVAQYRQVGNAVPPRLGYAVASVVASVLASATLPVAA